MKPLSACHRLAVPLLLSLTTSGLSNPARPLSRFAICAMFLLNLSLSTFSKASFLFIAPGLLFILLCGILASPIAARTWLFVGVSGRASASESRLATSFFDGRLRFKGFLLDFWMREINAECLIMRLSFFEDRRPFSLVGMLFLEVLDGAALCRLGIVGALKG